jgi:phage shock protein C
VVAWTVFACANDRQSPGQPAPSLVCGPTLSRWVLRRGSGSVTERGKVATLSRWVPRQTFASDTERGKVEGAVPRRHEPHLATRVPLSRAQPDIRVRTGGSLMLSGDRRTHPGVMTTSNEQHTTLGPIRNAFRERGLVRVNEGRVLGGVLAGLGRRLGLQPWPTRLLFLVLLLLIPGSQLLVYPVLWILMPAESESPVTAAP